MPAEVLEALKVIVTYCLEQDSCKQCPMHDLCEKMPCEYDLD